MNGEHLVKSSVTSNVTADTRPTRRTALTDKTPRTTELEKGMTAPMTTRKDTPSITLGTSPIGA